MSVDTHNVDFFGDFSTIRHVVGNHASLTKAFQVHSGTLRRSGIAEGLQDHLIGGVLQSIVTQCFAKSPRDIHRRSTKGCEVSTRNTHHIQCMGWVAFVSCFVHDGDEHGTAFALSRILLRAFKLLILCLGSRLQTFSASVHRETVLLAGMCADPVIVG